MREALLIPVIMCGGAGTRLWPVSRESMPKQFVPLVDERSTFQQILNRTHEDPMFDLPIIITNSDFRFIVAEQMRECAVQGDIVLEPIAATRRWLSQLRPRSPPNTTVSHVTCPGRRSRRARPDAFAPRVSRSRFAAAEGRIVTFGISPTFPATKYGYIQPGSELNGGAVLAVESFVEKPDAATARR